MRYRSVVGGVVLAGLWLAVLVALPAFADWPEDYERIFDAGDGVFDSPGGPASVWHRIEITADDRYVVVPVAGTLGDPNLPTEMYCYLDDCYDLAVWDRVTGQLDLLTHELNGDLDDPDFLGPFYWADTWDVTPDLRYLLLMASCRPGFSLAGHVCGDDGDHMLLRHDRLIDSTEMLMAAPSNGPFSMDGWQLSDDGDTVLLNANGEIEGISVQPHCPVPTDVDCEFLQSATYSWKEDRGWKEHFRTEDSLPAMDDSGLVVSFAYEYTACEPTCDGFFGLAEFRLDDDSVQSWDFPVSQFLIDHQTIPHGDGIYFQSTNNLVSSVYRLDTSSGKAALLKEDCVLSFNPAAMSQDGRFLLCEQGTYDNRIWMIDTSNGDTMDIFTPEEGFHGINDGYGIGNLKVVTRAPHELNAAPDAWLTDEYNYWVWGGEFDPNGTPDPEDPNRTSDTFTDDDGHTFEADIEWLAAEGITRGCNPPVNDNFCPDDFVTRGQMAAFLHRALDHVLTPTQSVEFIDDDGGTFEVDIEWLGGTRITRGCNPPVNNRYCPDDLVTRGQMAAFLVRGLGYTDDGSGNLFIDDNGSTFEDDINKLGTAGVTRGCNPPINNLYCPEDFVTRGQMAAFLHRALGS